MCKEPGAEWWIHNSTSPKSNRVKLPPVITISLRVEYLQQLKMIEELTALCVLSDMYQQLVMSIQGHWTSMNKQRSFLPCKCCSPAVKESITRAKASQHPSLCHNNNVQSNYFFLPISNSGYSNVLALLFKCSPHTKLGQIFSEILTLQVTHNTTEWQLKLASYESVFTDHIQLCSTQNRSNCPSPRQKSCSSLPETSLFSMLSKEKAWWSTRVAQKDTTAVSLFLFLSLLFTLLFTKSNKICYE